MTTAFQPHTPDRSSRIFNVAFGSIHDINDSGASTGWRSGDTIWNRVDFHKMDLDGTFGHLFSAEEAMAQGR